MIIEITNNIDDIKAILCSPDIYDTITDDNCIGAEEFEPPLNDCLYVGGYVDKKIVALMVYHSYLDGNKCHVQVLPEYRKEHAIEFGEQSLTFKGTLPLYAEIPDLYKNVLEFAVLNNFEIINKINDGYIKNGVSYAMNILKYKEV